MKLKQALPRLADVYPQRAQYRPEEPVALLIELENAGAAADITLEITVCHWADVLQREVLSLNLAAKEPLVFQWESQQSWNPGGYGVEVALCCGDHQLGTLSTTFDVARHWSDSPRYGFLSDFYPADEADPADLEQLRKYHINVVQFYDWMYRHAELIPPQPYFTDPMGRELSLTAVRNKIALCHALGMRAMAYGAVYTANPEFAAQHTDMQLYRNDGTPELFGGGWLHIMDVSRRSRWPQHITGQFARVVAELGFDGIHMDTYGYPKTALSRAGGREHLIHLEEEYPHLIAQAKDAVAGASPEAGVLFNAVGNWPVEAVAPAPQDAVYIEVWPPCVRYIHLHDLIGNARRAGNKQVILAAYLEPYKKAPAIEAERALLLAMATICASGGHHLVLGERNGVLCDPYYVEHSHIRDGFERRLRGYYDFIVRYGELLYDQKLRDVSMTHAGGINEEYRFLGGAFSSCAEPGKLWTIVKEMPGAKVIHLINLTGIASDLWNEGKKTSPRKVPSVSIRVLDNERALSVGTASPDDGGRLEPLSFHPVQTDRGRAIEFTVPELFFWRMVVIQCQPEE